MSLHPSLKIDEASATQRSVFTRIERIKDLMKKGLWEQERSVVGLPKTKIVRVKAAKAKKEEEATTATVAPTSSAAEAKGAPAKESKQPAKEAKQPAPKK